MEAVQTFYKTPQKPCFFFPDIPPVDELSFERLTLQNFEQLLQLFQFDASPFVDRRFKTYEGAKAYAAYLEEWGAYLPTHGGADWLFRVRGQLAGILHLYDLSLETYAESHTWACVGFATYEPYRKQGVTTRAMRQFVQTIFQFYPQINHLYAMTLPENTASQNFLRKLGFRDNPERSSAIHHFFQLGRAGAAFTG